MSMVNNTNAGQLLQIDDADPMVVYLPYRDTMPWTATTDRNEYDGTSHMTKTAGASITFSFIGSHVNVYGTLDGSGGNSSYVIDDDTPSVVVHPTTQQYHFPLYASNSLSYANHTLVIMSGANISTLRIDYMEITTKPGQVQPIPSTVSNIPTPSPGGSVEAKQFPAGVIAAIVLSSLVMLITIGVGVMMLLRCRRMRRLQAAPYKPNSKYDIDIEGEYQEISDTAASSVSDLLKIKAFRKQPQAPISQATSSAMFTSVIFVPPMPSSQGSNSAVGAPNPPQAKRSKGGRR